MSRCLSDDSLTRVVAELGTDAELAHLATCVTCTGRYRRLTGEVDLIRRVLLTTAAPERRMVRSRWRSVAAVAALSAAGVAALFWIEITAWRAIQPATDLTQAEQMTATLADVTAALFSVDGEPQVALADSPAVVALEHDATLEQEATVDVARCGDGTGLDDAQCAAVPFGLDNLDSPSPSVEDSDASDLELQDPMDVIELDAPERTVLETDNFDQGG